MNPNFQKLQQDAKNLLNLSINKLKQNIEQTECFDNSLEAVIDKMVDEVKDEGKVSAFTEDCSKAVYDNITCPECDRTVGFSVFERHLQKCLTIAKKQQKCDNSPTPDEEKSLKEKITRSSKESKKRGEEDDDRWLSSSKFMNNLSENRSKRFISPKCVVKSKSKFSGKNVKSSGADSEKPSVKKVLTYDSNSEESENDEEDSKTSNSELRTLVLLPVNSRTPLNSPVTRKKSKISED